MKSIPNLSKSILTLNKSLQKRSSSNYLRLLRSVCHNHRNKVWAEEALKLLSVSQLDVPTVSSLLNLADSLSSQKYGDASSHFEANQFANLIRKYDFPSEVNPYDPEVEALRKFEKSEHKCKRINERFRALRTRKRAGNRGTFDAERLVASQFMYYVLGNAPDLQAIYSKVGFGPGAVIGVSGNATNCARKLASDWSVTPGAYYYAFAATMDHAQIREMLFPNPGGFTAAASDYCPHKGPFSQKAKVVSYNKISFVPKTAKTHRSIAVEPLLNSLVQKGIDEVMRQKLRRIGIDLTEQEPNQLMAQAGSWPGAEDPFVTIDLSSASDSIATEVVRDLLPPEWFEFLNSCRSRNYNYRGVVKPYEKFCSMGNGFCFPLETLIFVSACHAVGAGRPGIDYRVYGDDIIVRQSVAEAVILFLDFLGFSVNPDKTFLQGPFRESCGADFFDGLDVRPYTLDFRLDSLQAVYKALNGMSSSERRCSFFDGVRPFLLSLIPSDFRFFRPYPGPEDTAIDSRCDEFLLCPHVSYRFKNGTGSWRWKELVHLPVRDKVADGLSARHGTTVLYAALVGSASNMPFAIRRKTRTKVRYQSHPGATSQWLPPLRLA